MLTELPIINENTFNILIMEQTFKKTVAGKYLQFNRLLYPTRYVVKVDEEGYDGHLVEFKKDGNGSWKPVIDGQSELWFKEKSNEIGVVIKENEEEKI